MSQRSQKRLVIVESPTKARTISRYLSSDYRVEASMGHVRDLPASAADIPEEHKGQAWARLGVRVGDGFEPLYVVTKNDIVKKLKGALRDADELYIATDEDREGESIGWHIVDLLDPKIPVKRMVFHEITEDAIRRALEETRDIDVHLVEAQETRRVLDRLVGYTISPLLWRKIAPKLSAGRVQSVAVRLLVLREHERMRFEAAGYWDLKAVLAKQDRSFEATLTHLDDIRVATGRDFDPDTGRLKEGTVAGEDVVLVAEDEARGLADTLEDEPWRVDQIEERTATRSPSAPFTTSTLQQEASRKLSLAARDTMRVAQRLYENGHITYMRTDSTNLSSEAIGASRSAIEKRYGKDYLFERVRQYRTKSRSAQEAHEAIRPAGTAMRTSQELGLRGAEASLYDLIWKRTVATQMAEARLKFVTARIVVQNDRKAQFRASGRTVLFPGFFRAYVEGSDDPEAALDDRDQPLPELAEGDTLDCSSLEPVGHETKPPARYTEASLVKLLEQEGIGRPSTYASIIDTIVGRGYVRKNGSQLVPTFTAFATNNLLEHQFRRLVDTEFTARMEADLDEIAEGKLDATPYLRDFYLGDEGIEKRVEQGLEQIDARAISTIDNPKWEPYRVRVGRFGPYVEGEAAGKTLTASIPEEVAPGDLTKDDLENLITEESKGDRYIGLFPESEQEMILKRGPYGPYLQLGGDDQKGKPKRISVPKGMTPSEVDEEIAVALLSLPRDLGAHPESGEPVEASIGRYGPYVRHQRLYASIPDDEDVLSIELPKALELLRTKEQKRGGTKLGTHPETGEAVMLREGRYGPYVKHGRTNASLRKDQDPESMTLEEALPLLEAKEAAKGSKKGGRKRGGAASKGKASKTAKASGKGRKGRARGGKKKAEKKPKATTADLAGFLDVLDPEVADVVKRLEGMNGTKAQDLTMVADDLGLSQEEIEARHKRGMFKLRMAYGKARKGDEA